MAQRARDADRSAVVEALSEAYADGQVSGEELEARTASALQAVHVADLQELVGDLRGPAVRRARSLMVPPAPPRPVDPWAAAAAQQQRDRELVTFARAVIIVVAVVAFGVAGFLGSSGGDDGSDGGSGDVPAQVDQP